MAIGDALTYPVIPQAAPAPVAPPPLPAEIVAQLQGYRDAFAGMGGDTAFAPAAMRFGLNLMQPVRPGDSPGGVFSRAGTDAMDYYTARTNQERNQLLQGAALGQKERELRSSEGATAESVAASRQRRGVEAAAAPVALGTAQTAYEKARADMDLLKQEELAGNRSPDFLRRKAVAEVALREALAKMYEAHSSLYRTTAAAQPAKNQRQTLNIKTVENADGTTSLVSTIVVNGSPYQQVFTPPRFQDIQAATKAATAEVEKLTPSAWNPFAGPAGYQGTREEEIARRTKEYMTPRLITVDSKGQQLTPQQFEAVGETPVTPGATPTPVPTPTPGAPMPPAFPRESQQQANAASERSLGLIRGELRDARKSGDKALIASLEKEEKTASERLKGGSPGHAPAAPVPTSAGASFVRDEKGNIVPQPQATKPGTMPAPTPEPQQQLPQPSEQAGMVLEQARTALNRARQALLSFGVRQQRADPVGYRNALMKVKQEQDEVSRAQGEYERLVAPNMGAVRGRTVQQ